MWLLKYGFNRAEVAVTLLLEAAAAEDDDARQDAGAAAQMPDAVPLLGRPVGLRPVSAVVAAAAPYGRLDSFPPSRNGALFFTSNTTRANGAGCMERPHGRRNLRRNFSGARSGT